MIEFFSSSVRVTPTLPAGTLQKTPGNGVFAALFAALPGGGLVAEEALTNGAASDTGGKPQADQDLTEPEEPEHAPGAPNRTATTNAQGFDDATFLPVSQMTKPDGKPDASLAACLTDASESGAASSQPVRPDAADPSVIAKRPESLETDDLAADTAPQPPRLHFVHRAIVKERVNSRTPDLADAGQADLVAGSARSGSETFSGTGQSPSVPALVSTDSADVQDLDKETDPTRSNASAFSTVQSSEQGAPEPRIAKDAAALPHPVAAHADRPVSRVPIRAHLPSGPSRLSDDPQPSTIPSSPMIENAAKPVGGSLTGYMQLSPPRPASGSLATESQSAANLSQQGAGFTAQATATSARQQPGDMPVLPPTETVRHNVNASRWVDAPPTESGRWAPSPSTGPIAPPQTNPFPGAAASLSHREHTEGGRFDQSTDGQVSMSPAQSSFGARLEHAITIPGSGVELARDAAQQIGLQVLNLGKGRFELTLSPVELGKVDMMLQENDNRLSLIINAERPETMDLIRRHIGLLELELRQMGLGNLSLQLDTGGAPGSHRGGQDRERHANAIDAPTESARPAPRQAPVGDHLDLRL